MHFIFHTCITPEFKERLEQSGDAADNLIRCHSAEETGSEQSLMDKKKHVQG